MIDPIQLRSFLHVVDAGTLSLAARRAHLSQPALSRQIKLLEDELGCALFERTGRGMRLNSAGSKLEPKARAVVAQLLGLQSDFRDAPVAGTVSLAVSPSMGMAWSAHLLRTFREHYPEVAVRVAVLLSGAMVDPLLRGAIDVGVLYSPPEKSHLRTAELWREPTFFVCRREYPWAQNKTLNCAQALSVPLILPSSQQGVRSVLEQEARALGLELQLELEVDSMQLALELVRQRAGNVLLTERTLPDIQGRRLVAVPIAKPRIIRTAQLATTEMSLARPAARALWDFVLDNKDVDFAQARPRR